MSAEFEVSFGSANSMRCCVHGSNSGGETPEQSKSRRNIHYRGEGYKADENR